MTWFPAEEVTARGRDGLAATTQTSPSAAGDAASRTAAQKPSVWPRTREQRDWFHKLGNILDKLPKRLLLRVKAALREVMYSETRAQVREAVRRFAAEYSPSRALEASPHLKRGRVAVRDGAPAAARHERRGLADEGAANGLQAAEHHWCESISPA
jgi:hypothetical protein